MDWMCGEEGGGRAEWVGGGKTGGREGILGGRDGGREGILGGREGRDGGKEIAYIWWKGVEEWAELVAGWVEETGQKGVVLTLYEITEGEGTLGQGISLLSNSSFTLLYSTTTLDSVGYRCLRG